MGTFRFKRFEVVNERSAMKVNTDGVLLGASMTILPSDRNLLDIGTGTGTIALMAAQRHSDVQRSFMAANCHSDSGISSMDHTVCRSISPSSCVDGRMVYGGTSEMNATLHIHAIDIDEASALEAGANFRNSPWPENLQAFHASLDEYEATSVLPNYDLIFSNPPYFEDSLNAPEQRRNNARHTSTGLSYREILDFAAARLSDVGRVALVLPAETEQPLCRHARMNGLHLSMITRIKTVPRKEPSRIVAEFSRVRPDSAVERTLVIQNEGKYTEEYLSLMQDFYLFA